MANFSIAIEKSLTHEGGYSNVASDLGGETYRGISRKYNPKWEGWKKIDEAKKKFPNGIIPRNTILKDDALEKSVKAYYKKTFWDTIFGDLIKNQAVAEIMFDAKLNQSGGFGYMVSNALNKSGNRKYPYYDKPLTGVKFNTDTVNAINFAEPSVLFSEFKNEREKYYEFRATKPGQDANLKGWLSRLQEYDYTGYLKNNPAIVALFFLLLGLVVFWYAHRKGWVSANWWPFKNK